MHPVRHGAAKTRSEPSLNKNRRQPPARRIKCAPPAHCVSAARLLAGCDFGGITDPCDEQGLECSPGPVGYICGKRTLWPSPHSWLCSKTRQSTGTGRAFHISFPRDTQVEWNGMVQGRWARTTFWRVWTSVALLWFEKSPSLHSERNTAYMANFPCRRRPLLPKEWLCTSKLHSAFVEVALPFPRPPVSLACPSQVPEFFLLLGIYRLNQWRIRIDAFQRGAHLIDRRWPQPPHPMTNGWKHGPDFVSLPRSTPRQSC